MADNSQKQKKIVSTRQLYQRATAAAEIELNNLNSINKNPVRDDNFLIQNMY